MGRKLVVVAATAALTFGSVFATTSGASAGDVKFPTTRLSAHLDNLNNSGVKGQARIRLMGMHGKHLTVTYSARGLLRNMPHAAHIHHGEQARHECPTVFRDVNTDHRISTAEGLPSYGPIRLSLTTRGDASPASALAVTRFPTAPNGRIDYRRSFTISRDFANDLKQNEGVLVIHGLDYNRNGMYDMEGAGPSELDPSLPAEATDPTACGRIIRR